MRELMEQEVADVSGGSKTGAAIALGATLATIAGVGLSIIGAPVIVAVAGVVAMGAAAAAGIGYAYDNMPSKTQYDADYMSA